MATALARAPALPPALPPLHHTGAAKAVDLKLLAPRADDPAWTHSTAWKLLSWVDPVKSGVVFGSGIFSVFSLHYMEWTWVQMAAYTSLMLITAGGIVNIAHSLQATSKRFPLFRVDNNQVADLAKWLGGRVAAALQSIASTTSWTHPGTSLLALASWYLTARWAGSLGTMSLLFLWVLAFTLPAAFMINRDAVYEHTRGTITPLASSVQRQLDALQAEIAGVMKGKYKRAVVPGLAIFGCGLLYLSLRYLSLHTTANMVSTAIVGFRLSKLTWGSGKVKSK